MFITFAALFKKKRLIILMEKNISIIALAALVAGCTGEVRHIDTQDVISKMSLEDKAHFVIGTGMEGLSGNSAVIGATKSIVPGAAGTTYPLDSLGVPAIVLADGPAGLRIDAHRDGDSSTYYCTHFPIGTLLASTWNQQLVEEVGKAIGEEVKAYGADVLLAPALNIHRNPLCGRNFEYYSEDPLVAGKTAAAYVRGVQSNGVGTSIKHFSVNNQETNRMNNDARVSQRALREIYLKGFEIAVKEGQPWTVMTSYNYINGVYASHNKELLQTVLRDEWGYGGTVMTDWFGGNDGARQIEAGNDMLQPGRDEQFTAIVNGVKDGTLKEQALDTCVARVLKLIERTPRYNGYKCDNRPDLKAHAAVTRQSAAEGMVLLANNGALPFDGSVHNVALYGCTSYDFIAGGTGSGNVNHAYVVSLVDGLKNAGYRLDASLADVYAKHIAAEKKRVAHANDGNPFAKYLPLPLPEEMTFSDSQLAAQVAKADIAVLTVGRLAGEFADRKMSDFNLSSAEQKLMDQVCAAYHAAGKKVVVLLNIGGVIETASWKDKPDAILCAWQAGQEGGNSVADVLRGKTSPSGKLTMTWPVNCTDHASTKNFPIDMAPDYDITKHGTLKADRKNYDYTDYEEDVFVGYRYFDSFGVPVSFPFGYGLSYTTFGYSDAKIASKGDEYEVSVKVTNTGKANGKEVVQLYFSDPRSKQLNKPVKELKAYAKTAELKPGESETVTMRVKAADLASFDESASAWRTDGGRCQFIVAASSHDVKATLTADVKPAKTKVNNVLAPKVKLNLLHR